DSQSRLEVVLEGGPWLIHKALIILKKWSTDTKLLKEELIRIPIWVKLHDVPLQVFEDDGISLIASFIAILKTARDGWNALELESAGLDAQVITMPSVVSPCKPIIKTIDTDDNSDPIVQSVDINIMPTSYVGAAGANNKDQPKFIMNPNKAAHGVVGRSGSVPNQGMKLSQSDTIVDVSQQTGDLVSSSLRVSCVPSMANVVALLGVPLNTLGDIDNLTKAINLGKLEVWSDLPSEKRTEVMETIWAMWDAFLTENPNATSGYSLYSGKSNVGIGESLTSVEGVAAFFGVPLKTHTARDGWNALELESAGLDAQHSGHDIQRVVKIYVRFLNIYMYNVAWLLRSKMIFHQALDLISELDETMVGCTRDILRQRDCLDQLSEVL
nr:zinc knuckle CX2CX4HX4C [Tanacetum cinerariifolium]